MATASRGEPRITLDLSYREAAILRTILSYVGGDPTGVHPRSHADAIANALDAIGVDEPSEVDVKGSLMIDFYK